MMRLLLIFLLALAQVAHATSYTNGPDWWHCQSNINLTVSGDIVYVTNGTSTWSTNLVITNNIQLIGSGIGQTIIIDGNTNRNNGGAYLLMWQPIPPTGVCRLSGFEFDGVSSNSTGGNAQEMIFQGTNDTFRVDHCYFHNLDAQYGCIRFIDAITGVIDHNQFDWTNGADYLYIENGSVYGNGAGNSQGWGDEAWANPTYWGTTNGWLYFEHNWFYHTNSSFVTWAICDSATGSKFVFRYNYCTNSWLYTHGTESSGRVRGFRAAEVYENTFVSPAGTGAAVLPLRSGTGVVWSNTVTGLSPVVGLADYRTIQNYSPWGGANGLNPWDTNNASLIATGTHTGTNGSIVLVDTNHSWTVNQWATNGYVVVDVTQDGTNYADYGPHEMFGMVTTNDAHTMTFIPGLNWGNLAWTNGDTYNIYQIYRTLDQPGAGQGDLVQDTSFGSGIPTNSLGGYWPHQAIDPIYQWGNVLDGNSSPLISNPGYSTVVLGVQYFDNTQKPGYTPLGDPYPGNSGGGSSFNGVVTLTATNIFFAPRVNWEMATEALNLATNSGTCSYSPNSANLGTNNAVWTWPVNLSCVGYGSDGFQYVLLSSNKVLLSSDFGPVTNTSITFHDTNGIAWIPVTTAITNVYANIQIGMLSSAAPAAMVVPNVLVWPGWTNYIRNTNGFPSLEGLPLIWPHKNTSTIDNGTLTFNVIGGTDMGFKTTSGLKCSGGPATGGDSNSPIFAILNGRPVLLFVLTQGGSVASGTFIGSSNAMTAYLSAIGSTSDLKQPNFNAYPNLQN